jgi:DNA-binding NarL/FixJ family response regulator
VAKVRVLIADDHPAMLANIRLALNDEFEVVGEAENGLQVCQAALKLSPDIIVLDISMPVMDGLQAARKLQKTKTHARIVFLTVHEDPDFVTAAFSSGASCYVAKSRLSSDLKAAIRAAWCGGRFISQCVSEARLE